jgi:hypothetical protein
LAGVHGRFHYKETVCEHWWALAASHDIIVLSSASHINELLMFPNETAAAVHTNDTTLIDASANLIARKLKQLKLKPSAVIVYMTASSGITNFSKDCNLPPEDTPLPYDALFNWHMVPYMQQTYVRTFRQAMRDMNQPFLVLDMQHLMQMRRGCRGDFVHAIGGKASPYFHTWLALYNLLVAYNNNGD